MEKLDTHTIKLEEFDTKTKAYLLSIYKSGGQGYPGVFKSRDINYILFWIIGIFVLLASLFFYDPTMHIPMVVQILTFAIGIYLIYKYACIKHKKRRFAYWELFLFG